MNAIYARQSVDKKDSISIETQINICRAGCGCDDARVYSDKGYSGSNVNRPEFQQMLNDIRNGLVNKVFVYKLDRISRSLPDFVKMMEEFDAYGCSFVSVTESFDTGTPIGRAMLQICMVFSQLERENTIQRVRDAYSARSREGFYMGGRIPYGYQLKATSLKGKKTSMYEPVYDEAEQVKMIYDLYSQPGVSLNDVVKYLVNNGIKKLRGAEWQTSRLSDMIKNPCYVKADANVFRFFQSNGTIIINDISEFDGTRAGFMFGRRTHGKKFSDIENQTLVLALHEGFIEPEVWLRCQLKLKRNKQIKRTGIGKTTWLSGLVKCAKCGHTMKIVKSNTKAGRYFNCTGRSELHICEGHNCTIYADAVEKLVYNEITEKLAANEFINSRKASVTKNEINQLTMQLNKVETEITNLLDKLAMSNEALFKYINKRISELDLKKQEIERKITELKLTPDTDADILELGKIWREDNFEKKKLIASTLIKEIRINDNQIEIIWTI